MKNLLKGFFLKTLLACVASYTSIFLISCTDDNPIAPEKTSSGTIYFFTQFTNPVTREREQHFCRMNDDGSKRTLISQLPNALYWPQQVQYSANMKRLMYDAYSIMNIDGSERRYMTKAWAEESYQALSPDGEHFFQAYSSWCQMWDAATSWKKRELPREGGYYYVWSYDSKRLIVNSNGSIVSRNIDSAADRKILYAYNSDSTAGRAARLYSSPYHDQILFERYGSTSADNVLCLMNGDGTILHTYSTLTYSPRLADWSRDGKSVLLQYPDAAPYTYQVSILDLSSGTLQPTVKISNMYAGAIRFSPDGKRLLYTDYIKNQDSTKAGQYVLKTVNINGLGEKILTPEGYNDASPGWAP
ncbi:MAG: hypothetical protein V4642_07035 [Bacteroidota bacterium]